jgi:hypothetical protein
MEENRQACNLPVSWILAMPWFYPSEKDHKGHMCQMIAAVIFSVIITTFASLFSSSRLQSGFGSSTSTMLLPYILAALYTISYFATLGYKNDAEHSLY